MREQLQVDANGTDEPMHAITFVGVEGALPGSPTHLKWQQTYARFGQAFFSQGSFRIRDLSGALGNYTIHDFGAVVRAGRMARRTVVFPNSIDKAMWVIDVDGQTNVPLYAAEFDIRLRLLSEVEVLTFVTNVAPLSAMASSVTSHADFQSAKNTMGQPPGLIDPNTGVASEYQIHSIQVRDDPINGRQTLEMRFTDGIDQFVVTQTPNAPDIFDGLPAKGQGQTIGRYRDPAMSVLIFWEGGVFFQVAGSGALHRLDALSRRLYLQAIASN
ncbi:MAG: hypothetical protein WAT39_08490 [Planctomycetota bacterium]